MEQQRLSGQKRQRLTEQGTPFQSQVGGSLNPTWVEWLMGWPIHWGSIDEATVQQDHWKQACLASSWWVHEPPIPRVAGGVPHRVPRLQALGNGQVPVVAAFAWTVLQSWREAG